MADKVCDCRHYPYDCWSCLSECDVRAKEPKKEVWSDASCMANGQRADDNKRANKNF